MGTKHDLLTEEEMASFTINPRVAKQIEELIKIFPNKKRSEINILDWGCGRGRSVAYLREKGFNAFGADIDVRTIANGFRLFEDRGLLPRALLKPIDELSSFENGFFHLIFSEQVLEHVADLTGTLAEQARLTDSGGIGIHCFPGSRNVWEGHLNMPLVHWLPKTNVRKFWISIMLLLSIGPKEPWPETKAKSHWETVDILYRYMNERTYYRDNERIQKEFETSGFEAKYSVDNWRPRLKRFFSHYFRRNGFPRGGVTFTVKRRGDSLTFSSL